MEWQAGYISGAIKVALGASRKARDGAAVRRCRGGDRDGVERLEQGDDVPDRRERVAIAVAEARVIPMELAVAPARLRERDPTFSQGEVVLLRARERRCRRARSRRERGLGAHEHGSAEQRDKSPLHRRWKPNRRA